MATLPSSPPRRIHSRRSSRSSNSSQYSLDLDALMPPDEDDTSSLAMPQSNKHAIDIVDSEDIDGPSDFTQNMEYWMSAKLPTVVTPTKLEGTVKEDMEEYVGSDDTESTRTTTKHAPLNREEQSEDGTPQPSPNRRAISANHDFDPDMSTESIATHYRKQDGGMPFQINISHGDESSPATVQPGSPLSRPVSRQARVEDYEDTPIRLRDIPAASTAISATLRSPELTLRGKPTPKPAEEALTAQSHTEKSLEMVLNQLREELAAVRAQTQDQIRRQSQEHEAQASNERAEHQKVLRHMEDLWQAKLTELRTSYEAKLVSLQVQNDDTSASRAGQRDELERRVKHYSDLCEQKETRIGELDAQVRTQDEQLQEAKKEIITLGRELETMDEKYRVAQEDLQEERTDHGSRYQTLRSEYERLEASKMDADDRIETLEAELSSRRAEELLEAELKFQALQTDYNRLQATKLDIEDKLKEVEAQISRAASNHTQELERTEAKAEETVTKARESFASEKQRLETRIETMEEENRILRIQAAERDAELQRLQVRNHDESSNRAQVETLTKERDFLIEKFKEQKAKHAKSLSESQNTTNTLETRIKEHDAAYTTARRELQTLQSDLVKARKHAKTAHKETEAACEELDKVKEDLQMLKESTEAVNAAFDDRVKEMLRQRESEWSRRYEALRKEKGIMGRVLMKEWGEKEVGLGVPQGYRYKFF